MDDTFIGQVMDEGFQAYYDGWYQGDNPYDEPDLAAAWNVGWVEAALDDEVHRDC